MLLGASWLAMAWIVAALGAELELLSADESAAVASRACTVDDLMPQPLPTNSSMSHEWSDEFVTEQPYGCECSFYRERYFCPSVGDRGYPKWKPRAVAEGVCESVTREQLADGPFPPNSKVLIYGNSFMRQVLEATLCMFHEEVTAKLVSALDKSGDFNRHIVPGDRQCRGCTSPGRLVDHGCVAADTIRSACRCNDDRSEYYLANGAVVHYYFANGDRNKSVEDAVQRFGTVSFAFYDVVIANPGNTPRLAPARVLDAAIEAQAVGASFFWLSAFHYHEPMKAPGNVYAWTSSDRAIFERTGAKFVAVGDMSLGLHDFTVEEVESKGNDPHFCLPGPPNEIGLLLLKVIWAIPQNSSSSRAV